MKKKIKNFLTFAKDWAFINRIEIGVGMIVGVSLAGINVNGAIAACVVYAVYLLYYDA